MIPTIITFTTDFGLDDSYVAQMKGVILSLNPNVQLVDVTHAVPPQNIAAGAAILDEMVDAFPPGAIHVAVVDPGVGSERSLVAVKMGRWRFVAPDNGLLTAVAARFPPQQIIRLTQSRFWREPVSNTFHGRDILAPVAAHLSLGVDLIDLGELHSSIVSIPLPAARREAASIVGEITHVDRFGNLVTSIHASWLADADRERVEIDCSGRIIRGLKTHYADSANESLLALIGSSGRLEIARRNGNAAETLKAAIGSPVRVRID